MRNFISQITAIFFISLSLLGAQSPCSAVDENLQEGDNRSNNFEDENPSSDDNKLNNFNNFEEENIANKSNELVNYATREEGATIVQHETSYVHATNLFDRTCKSLLKRWFSDITLYNFPGAALSNDNSPGQCFASNPERNADGEIIKPVLLTVKLETNIMVERIAIKHPRKGIKRESMPKDIVIYRIEENPPSKINENPKKTVIGNCLYDADSEQEAQNCELTEDAKNQTSQIIQFAITSSHGTGYISLYQVIIEGPGTHSPDPVFF